MSNQSTIKSLLEVKIDEMINSVQRRMNLNVQTLQPAKTSNRNAFSTSSKQNKHMVADQKVGKVIAECNQTLNKLFFLKSALNEINEEDGVYFLDNYHLFSFDDFCNNLYERSRQFQNNSSQHTEKTLHTTSHD